MMKVSDEFGGMGSVATSAVPVFEKTVATCGNSRTARSTASCMACDCAIEVDGILRALSATSFSSSVGMNSCPSVVNRTPAPTSSAAAAARTGSGWATAPARARR